MSFPIAMAAVQLISGFQQAEMIRAKARLQQDMNEMNAQYIERDAWEAEKFGYTQASRYATNIASILGEQKVGLAAQGVDISSGTAKEIQEETKLTGFLNTLDLQRAGRAKAYGLKIQASNVRLGNFMQGQQAELDAQGSIRGGALNAAAYAYKGFSGYSDTKDKE